ncbi:MAG: pyridoxamine 5'-phosphate oxidase family protein, partial [Gemmatimonadota bacterium]
AAAFLNQARLVVVSTTDDKGRPWASVLTGEPGFVQTPDPFTAVISAEPAAGDPLARNLIPGHQIGLLAPDFATRRRMRLNGTIEGGPPGRIVIRAEQVYGNCPKYIQRRVPVAEPGAVSSAPVTGRSLSIAQRNWIRQADTFFIATANPGEGADASHRGGQPGFIHVQGDRVRWPDYSGNMMFNTIGNVLAHPWAGVTIPDFVSGNLLLLSGRASVDWSPSPAEVAAGAERVMQLEVDRIIELDGALPFRAEWVEPSPFNPGLPQIR